MKCVLYVLAWTVLACDVRVLSQRSHLNHLKPFVDPNYIEWDVQVPKTHENSYSPPMKCSSFLNIVHCMKLEVMHNVSEIIDSDMYWLTNNLVIEKLPSSKLNSRDDIKNRALSMKLKKLLNTEKESNKMILEGAMGIFRTHTLRWIVNPSVNLRLQRNPDFGGKMDLAVELGEDSLANAEVAPRTFFRRKLQFALLSVMYKMGVITTLLGALVLISLKTLAVGMVLLFLTGINTVKAIGAKLHGLGAHGYSHNFHHHPPEIIEALPSTPQHKEVHVHIHNSGGAHGHVSESGPSSGYSNGPYHGWSNGGSSGGSLGPYRRSSVETNTQQTSSQVRGDEQVLSF